jgi:hypothetical protein
MAVRLPSVHSRAQRAHDHPLAFPLLEEVHEDELAADVSSVAHVRDAADEELLKVISAALKELGGPPVAEACVLVVPVRFRRGKLALNLFSTVTTLGRARDVTLEELRVEMFFPADEPSKRALEGRRRG